MVRKLGLASASVVVTFVFLVCNTCAQVDGSNRVGHTGNLRPEATPENDRGRVPDSLPIQHMLLQLKRSSEQELSLQQYLDELQTKGSPNFHHWLTAREFGTRFGVDQSSLQAITAWLRSEGFQINVVYPSGMLIDFSGTAGQVRRTLQTEIHHLAVHGELHIANMSEPRIPAALAASVAGVVSLNDFRPHSMNRLRKPHPEFTFTDIYGDLNYPGS
jgi:subtilase family serine protease